MVLAFLGGGLGGVEEVGWMRWDGGEEGRRWRVDACRGLLGSNGFLRGRVFVTLSPLCFNYCFHKSSLIIFFLKMLICLLSVQEARALDCEVCVGSSLM